jgi:hypothetical protein
MQGQSMNSKGQLNLKADYLIGGQYQDFCTFVVFGPSLTEDDWSLIDSRIKVGKITSPWDFGRNS